MKRRGVGKTGIHKVAIGRAVPLLIGMMLTVGAAEATNPDPQFAAPVTNPFGFTAQPNDPTGDFGDLDGDGDLDLVCGVLDGSHRLFWNTGNSTAPAFAAPINVHPAAGGPASSVELADLDGDGDLDTVRG